MTEAEMAALKEHVERWKRVGPLLEAQREDEVRKENTMSAFAAFRGMALLTLRTHPPESSSGLVEQQAWFMKLAGRNR